LRELSKVVRLGRDDDMVAVLSPPQKVGPEHIMKWLLGLDKDECERVPSSFPSLQWANSRIIHK